MVRLQQVLKLLAALIFLFSTNAFAPLSPLRPIVTFLRDGGDAIVSPFDTNAGRGDTESTTTATYNPAENSEASDGPMELTWENVEKVLDELRPFLIQDGGNVAITEIDGPVVKLELQVRSSTAQSEKKL
jgi:hypothetical protein